MDISNFGGELMIPTIQLQVITCRVYPTTLGNNFVNTCGPTIIAVSE